MRSKFEPDSLLVLSTKYLSLSDLSTFEVCIRLHRLDTPLWDELLAEAEKRTGASRPMTPGGTGNPNAAYCSKLSLMYLLRSVDCAVDIEERTRAGEFFKANKKANKLLNTFRECDHIFVRISQKVGNSDGGSYRMAWQGFVIDLEV